MNKVTITDEQMAMAPKLTQEWIDRSLRETSPCTGLEEQVAWLYRLGNLSPPDIYDARSPREMFAKAHEFDSSIMTSSAIGCGPDSAWTAHYDFYIRYTDVVLSNEMKQNWDQWVKFISKAWDCILFNNLAILCQRPSAVRTDARNRLHSLDKPAIEWSDGYCRYFIHGVEVDSSWILNPESIKKTKILRQTNAELRKAMIQIYGLKRFLGKNSTPIDQDIDGAGMPRSLYRFKAGREFWVVCEVVCPSKGDTYFLWVPPETLTCREAIAWTYALDPSQYAPDVER